MSITLKHNEKPDLKEVKFVCDSNLHSQLDNYEITSLMNKHVFAIFLGKAGSGKTSLLISFLKTPELFHRVFDKIYVFMPSTSRASLKDNFFEKHLPEDRIYDDLDVNNFTDAYERARENAEDNKTSLIILDDVQKALKDPQVSKMLLHAVNNRRHARLSIWLVAQTYNSIPRQVRQGLTDMFVFKINKTEQNNIFDEVLELKKDVVDRLYKHLFKKPHDFMYINTNSQRIFSNWDELLINDDA